MLIDNVVVQVEPTITTEEELKIFVANSKMKFMNGRLSKIIITPNKDGGFDVDFSVKNLSKL